MNIESVAEWVKTAASKDTQLRDYQIEAWYRLWTRRKEGRRRALMHLATGLGKTSVAAVDVLHFLREECPGSRVLFVSHMNDISYQAQQTFLHVNPHFTTTFFRSGRKPKEADVTFATFQGLFQELDHIEPDRYAYIVWDEAHHTEAETFAAVRKYFNPIFELGLTATPERADGRDILNYFGKPLFSKSLADGIVEGWLSPVDYHIVFDEAIKKAMSEKFELDTIKQIRDLFAIRPRNEMISKEVLERRHNIGMDHAKTIVFCQNKEAAEEMAVLLHGEFYHSGIETGQRLDILRRFRDGKLQVICTVDMFNEGIDIPDARLVVFLRSTSSRTIFEQQLGRGLRRSPGKDKVTVLDFVANVERINFVRELGHSVSSLGGARDKYRVDGVNYDGGAFKREDTTNRYFGISTFEFEDQAIELLDRYSELKEIDYLTDEQVVAAYDRLGNVMKVAESFGVSNTAIYKHLKRAGVDTSSRFKNHIPIELVVKTYFELRSANKAGEVLGLSSATVLDRVRRAGYATLPVSEAKYANEETIALYRRNNNNLRKTARELGVDRVSLRKQLIRAGVNTAKQVKGPPISREWLQQLYTTHKGDIREIMRNVRESGIRSWVDIYRLLDEYGYVQSSARPLTSALVAAAYYKFGTSTKTGEFFGVSASYISRLSRDAVYLPKYNKGRTRNI